MTRPHPQHTAPQTTTDSITIQSNFLLLLFFSRFDFHDFSGEFFGPNINRSIIFSLSALLESKKSSLFFSQCISKRILFGCQTSLGRWEGGIITAGDDTIQHFGRPPTSVCSVKATRHNNRARLTERQLGGVEYLSL